MNWCGLEIPLSEALRWPDKRLTRMLGKEGNGGLVKGGK